MAPRKLVKRYITGIIVLGLATWNFPAGACVVAGAAAAYLLVKRWRKRRHDNTRPSPEHGLQVHAGDMAAVEVMATQPPETCDTGDGKHSATVAVPQWHAGTRSAVAGPLSKWAHGDAFLAG